VHAAREVDEHLIVDGCSNTVVGGASATWICCLFSFGSDVKACLMLVLIISATPQVRPRSLAQASKIPKLFSHFFSPSTVFVALLHKSSAEQTFGFRVVQLGPLSASSTSATS